MTGVFANFPEIRMDDDIGSLELSVTWVWKRLGGSQDAGGLADAGRRARWPRPTSDGRRLAALLGFPSREMMGWI